MPEFIDKLLRDTGIDELWVYVAAAIAVLGVLLLVSLRERFVVWRENRQIARFIRRLGTRSLGGLHLADGTGGEVVLDFLVLAQDRLLVVGIKRYSGLIFGSPHTDQWTQVINRVSYKFPNPDEYLLRQVNAVRALAPGVRVQGIHLFTKCARFPKDKPANVLSTSELKRLPKRPRHRDIPAALRQAWEQVSAAR